MIFGVIYEGADELDDDEEFFFESIERYNTLQMFELDSIPHHILRVDDTSICLAVKRSNGENSELLKLGIPRRLSLPLEEQGLTDDNDFVVLSGVFTKGVVYQIGKIEDSKKIITSEYNNSGLQIYSFEDNSSGTERPDEKIEVTPWTATNFDIIQETKNVICSKDHYEPLILADVSVGQIIKEIQHPFYAPDTQENAADNDSSGGNPCYVNNVKCRSLSPDQIAILNADGGEVVLHDLRSKDSFVSLPGDRQKQNKEIWTLSSCDYRESSLDYFGIMSNTSSFCIYDKRNNSVVIENTGTDDPREDCCWMKMKFSNESNVFSISGLNSFVEIFKINGQQFDLVFTHKGHCPSNLPTVLSTDHIWLQAGENEYVLSVSDNGTLNCWEGIF